MAKKRRPSRTAAVVELLDRAVWSQKDDRRKTRGMTLVDQRLTESYSNGELDLFNDIDLDGVYDRWVRRNERFADSARQIERHPTLFTRNSTEEERLREHVIDGISFSQFERFMDTCVRLGTFSFCASSSPDMILGLVGRMTVDCTQTELLSDPFLIEDDFDISNPPDSTTPMGGLADPVRMGLPKRYPIKLGYAIKRDMFCGGFAQKVKDLIEKEIGPKFDRRMAKQIIPLIFNLYGPGKNPWMFNMDGCGWETYYANVAGAPWINMTYVAQEFDSCQYGMFCAVEEAFDKVENPRTGDPMTCCDEYQIVTAAGRCTMEKFRTLLGVHRVEADVSNGGTKTCGPTSIAYDVAARSGWGTFRTSRFLTKFMMDALTAKLGLGTTANWTAAQVRQSLDRTWLAGCPSEAFKLTTEWQRDEVTLEGTNTFQYWNQEIVWMKRWMEKTGFMVNNPWAVHLVRGLPDGKKATDYAL